MAMLTRIRRMTKTGILIIILVFVASIVLGASLSGKLGGEPYGLLINDEEVSLDLVERLINNQTRGGGELSDTDRAKMATSVVERIVGERLALAEGVERGLVPTDKELVLQIKRLYFANQDGSIDEARFNQNVKNASPTEWRRIEESVRDEATLNKAYLSVAAALVHTPESLRDYYNVRFQRAKIRHILIKPSLLVSNERVLAYYDNHPDSFFVEERVKGRHILYRIPPSPTDQQKFQARTRSQTALIRMQAGTPFARLYAEALADTSGAVLAQELDWFNRGQMVPTFDSIAFIQPVGVPTGIIETQFGYHIALFDGHELKHRETLKEMEVMIRNQLTTESEVEKARAMVTELKEKIDAGESLERLAAEHSDAVSRKEDGLIGYVIPGEMTPDLYPDSSALRRVALEVGTLGQDNRVIIDPNITRLLFDLDVGQNSEVTRSGHGFHILRIEERKSANPDLWENLRPQVTKEYKDITRRQIIDDWRNYLRKNADVELSDYVKRRTTLNYQ